MLKAVARRLEFRRIKKTYQLYTAMKDDETLTKLEHYISFQRCVDTKQLVHKKFTERELPRYLSEPDWYLVNYEPCIDMDVVADESDVERVD